MRKGGSKAKGSKFERDIAKRLGLALFNDADSFVRTPGSGALATVRGNDGMPFGGDIMQVKHTDRYKFPFSIECKHYKSFDIFNILTRKEKSIEYKAWLQCARDAKQAELYPLLIYKANNRPIYLVCRTDEELPSLIEEWLDKELYTIEGVFTDGKLMYIPLEVFEKACNTHPSYQVI